MQSQAPLESYQQVAQWEPTALNAQFFLGGSQEAAVRMANDSFATEDWWMYTFKVVPCPLRESHDWAQCPYVHPGEKMRRRDPRQYDYTGIACPHMRQEGRCSLGDTCPFAHNDPEYWLHPTRYHTAICKQGAACQRRFCFFVHHPSKLRTDAPRPSVSPHARAMQLAASAGQLLPYAQAGGGSERGSSGSPARCSLEQQRRSMEQQRSYMEQPWASGCSGGGRQEGAATAAGRLMQGPGSGEVEATLGQGQASLELRAGVILRMAAAASSSNTIGGGSSSSTIGGAGGGSSNSSLTYSAPASLTSTATATVPLNLQSQTAGFAPQWGMQTSYTGSPSMGSFGTIGPPSNAFAFPASPTMAQLAPPLGGAPKGPAMVAAAGPPPSETVTDEVAMGRLDMTQAAAILRHVLLPNELLRIELQVEGALAQHQA